MICFPPQQLRVRLSSGPQGVGGRQLCKRDGQQHGSAVKSHGPPGPRLRDDSRAVREASAGADVKCRGQKPGSGQPVFCARPDVFAGAPSMTTRAWLPALAALGITSILTAACSSNPKPQVPAAAVPAPQPAVPAAVIPAPVDPIAALIE